MEYNTARPKMEIPEYGRITLKLAQHLLTIEDRDKRNAAARALLDVMSFNTPQFRHLEEFKMRLWDHLHMMTDYKLDVDSPYPKPKRVKPGEDKPAPLPYPKNKIRYRNYGKNMERLLDKILEEVEDSEKKKSAAEVMAYYMKLVHLQWGGNQLVSDDGIKNDLGIISKGELEIVDYSLDHIKGKSHTTIPKEKRHKKNFKKPGGRPGGGSGGGKHFRKRR